jgi:hypothetical protein
LNRLNGLNRLSGKEQRATPLLAENVKIERASLSAAGFKKIPLDSICQIDRLTYSNELI